MDVFPEKYFKQFPEWYFEDFPGKFLKISHNECRDEIPKEPVEENAKKFPMKLKEESLEEYSKKYLLKFLVKFPGQTLVEFTVEISE